jgi:IS1 family transposase
VIAENGYSEVTSMMNDYYSLYTWAMDKHAALEREATQRRLVRHSPYTNTHDHSRLRWPLIRRRDDERKAA